MTPDRDQLGALLLISAFLALGVYLTWGSWWALLPGVYLVLTAGASLLIVLAMIRERR
jgi:hypothetical protein